MSAVFSVTRLPRDQRQWVIEQLVSGSTDQKIATGLKEKFGVKIGKTSIFRYRTASRKLLDKYKLAEFQVAHLLRQTETSEQAYQKLMAQAEDMLTGLLASAEIKNPVALLAVRVQEEIRALREKELSWKQELEAQKLEIQRERMERETKSPVERADEFLETFFEFAQDRADLLELIEAVAEPFRKFVKKKYERTG